MRTHVVLALLTLTLGGGCANVVDPKLIYGTYDVMVSAFGKTDTTIAVASEGDNTLLLAFTAGFSTPYGAENATGLRVGLDGSGLSLDAQPVHVEHSTGILDGTLTGVGRTGGATLSLTLKVLPSNAVVKDANGDPLPAGATVDYEVQGARR